MSRRVFVTGATGVIGRRVVPMLVEAGHSVTAVARSKAKADAVRAAGATPVSLDLFDRAAVCAAIANHDCVAQLATHIPTGASAARRSAWRTNDSLRRKASAAIAAATIEAGVGRLIQESITFPYIDGGDQWIEEDCERAYFSATRSTVDDAATAVLSGLDAPAGIYNVAEPEPVRRSSHRDALAAAVSRRRLRPMPQVVERVGGNVASSLARSHRISSRHLCDVSPWVPTIHCVDKWKELG